MRTTIVILSLVASIVAEAPYHLPRPSAPFNFPPAPPPAHHHHHHHHAPPPPPPVQYQQPQQIFQPAPQQYAQNGGYQYQQPNIQPTFIQPAPRPQYQIPQPVQPQPVYQPQPIYQQPAPQPIYQQPAPQPIYQQPAPQPISQPQPQYYQPPSTSYGVPQLRPQPQPQPLPTYIAPQPQPRPQIQPQQVYQPVQQFSQQQGYNYQQPQIQFSAQPQYTQLQSQALTRNPVTTSLSSYQADSNQYSGAQAQGEALDSVVVNQVQNIIKESEHTSARDSGYLSLVSGVSLENAQPSIEISSFTHTAPLNIGGSLRQSSSSVSGPSADYGVPSITQSEQQSSGGSLSFLPQSKPATAYGAPNKK